MKLEKFIETTITQAAKGVKAAQDVQKKKGEHGAKIGVKQTGVDRAINTETGLPIHLLTFDVEVVGSTEVEGDLRVDLALFGKGLEAEGNLVHQSGRTNRVKFTVPIQWPDPK